MRLSIEPLEPDPAGEHAGLRLPPTRAAFAPLSPAQLCAHGLVARKDVYSDGVTLLRQLGLTEIA